MCENIITELGGEQGCFPPFFVANARKRLRTKDFVGVERFEERKLCQTPKTVKIH
jgi:hypothetical protein